MAEFTETLILNADMQPLTMLPLSTTNWRGAIGGVISGGYTVVHEYDDWTVHSQKLEMAVPAVVMMTQYVRPHFWPKLKGNLWLRDNYTCQYCMHVFPASELTQDHVVPQKFGGGTSWENLVAACHPCNNRRGHNVKIQPKRAPYKPSYFELVELRKKYPVYVPHESWAYYLAWPEDKVFLRKSPF
jgi:5-methylcytosine-specific restriction endonuclease McrA